MFENESASTLGGATGARRGAGGTGDGASGLDPAMAELLEIYEGPLREASFPDVSREVLRALVGEVEASLVERERKAALVAEAEAVVAEAEAAVASARLALREAEAAAGDRQRALLARGQRALSYAKVFAETDPGLHARLSAISLARIAQRGRPSTPDSKRAVTREPRTPSDGATPDTSDTSAPAPRKRGRPAVVRAESEPVELSASG
jgi:multidrug efflux pump subunit AcrA (membrane-fusion protein)